MALREWESLHEDGATNAQIAAGAAEHFLSSEFNRAQMIKFGQSFNALEINNDDNTIVVDCDLDGLTSRRRRIFAKGNLVINPEDGIFFNTIKITNTDGANALSAGKLKINARIVRAKNA